MGWLRRHPKPSKAAKAPKTQQRGARSPEPDGTELDAKVLLDPDLLHCVSCGRPLGFDPEDEPDGDGPGRHLCGECNRARNFDAELEMMWWNGDL